MNKELRELNGMGAERSGHGGDWEVINCNMCP